MTSDLIILDGLWHAAVRAQTNGSSTWDQRHANLYEWQSACAAYEQASGLEIDRSEDMATIPAPHRPSSDKESH